MIAINITPATDHSQINEYKSCSKCFATKKIVHFYKDKNRKDGFQYQCKECAKDNGKRHYQKNIEKILERKKRYHQKNRDKALKRGRQYRQENIDNILNKNKKYRQANPKKLRESARQYLQTESGRANSLKSVNKRRALKAGATVEDFTPKEIFNRDHYICQACGIKTRPDYKNRHHSKYPNLDHIIPLSVGGEHSKRNTQCLCHGCNMSKGNRHANDQMLLIG